jgi:hypothetical protein
MKYFYRILGGGFILTGIILNEWVIKYLTHGQVKFAEIEKQILIAMVNICLVVLGILIIRYQKIAFQNMLLFSASVIVTFGFLEVGLRFIPPDLESESPRWIPHHYKLQNIAINQEHKIRSKVNPYGFNDMVHPFKKNPGSTRIAVLGDSFVWGAGAEQQHMWTRKLEKMMNQNGMNVTILNWGKPGWSTLDEFQFLKSEGIKYEFDLLLIGFVVNDPMMDQSKHRVFIYSGGIIDRLFVQPLSQYLIPNTASLFVDLINQFFDRFFGYGYCNWLNHVYSPDNLQQYQSLLFELAAFFKNHDIRALVVMTPENHNPLLQERFEIVADLFQNAEIPYFNLYPDVYETLHHIPNRKLWANPADGHPGEKVTDVYAQSIYQYLIDHNYLN